MLQLWQSMSLLAYEITIVMMNKVLTLSILRKTEEVVRRYSVKKLFLKISQNSQESTSFGVFFLIKLQACSLLYRTLLTFWMTASVSKSDIANIKITFQMILESFFILSIGLWTCINNNISYHCCQVYYRKCEQLIVNKIGKIGTVAVTIKRGFIHTVQS